MADNPTSSVEARAALGRRLARLRAAAGYTQEAFAPKTFYGRSSIANIETGRQTAPRDFWVRCDDILQTGGLLSREHDRLTRSRREHELQLPASVGCAEVVSWPGPLPDAYEGCFGMQLCQHLDAQDAMSSAMDRGEDVVDVLARVRKLGRSVDPAIIDHLRGSLQHTLAHYDDIDHSRLGPSLIKQRALLESLLDDCMHPQQRQQLFESAALTSGLLGYVAVGRASFRLARAYCLEAFQLADFAQDSNLRAWARGMQSFCEYYAGDYGAALRLALDGVAYAEQGPQSVRLTINGAARASGKLADVEGVRRAIGKAYDLMSQHNAPSGVPSSIALGCYSAAQVASNAATAYVSLGMPKDVQYYIDLAMPDISRSGSPWSRSLVMLDLSSSLIGSDDHDLDYATELVLNAIRISHGRPVISVSQRALDFICNATNRWGATRQVDSVREALASAGGNQ